MANSFIDYAGDNSTTLWSVPFAFLDRGDVDVIDLSDSSAIAFTWISDSQIEITPAVVVGINFRLRRVTGVGTRAVDYQDGSALNEDQLDLDSKQAFYKLQEIQEQGAAGTAGPAGATGAAGNSVLNGTGAPAGGTGVDGDFYIDTATYTLYGPKAGGTWPAGVVLNTPDLPVGTGPLAPHKNLVVTYTTASQVTVTADKLVVETTGGATKTLSTISEIGDITISGAGGLDTSDETTVGASTWFDVYVIHNGTDTAALLVKEGLTPSMPSGYTYKAFVGNVYNDSSLDFVEFHQIGKDVIVPPQLMASTNVSSYTSVSLVTAVPLVARFASGHTRVATGSNSGVRIDVASTAAGLGEAAFYGASSGSTSGSGGQWELMLKEAQTIYYDVSATSVSFFNLYCSGYSY